MKRRIFAALLCLTMSLSLAACGSNQNSAASAPPASSQQASQSGESESPSVSGGYDGPAYELQLGHIAAEGALEDTVAKRFKALVEEASGGKIQITLYGNSQMGGLTDLVDALRYDTLDLAIFTMGNAESYYPKAKLWGLPYQISNYEHAEAFYKSELYAQMNDEFAQATNCRELGSFHVGFRVFMSTKPINNADDLKGLKLRIPEVPLFSTTFGALGANTTAIPMGDCYQSLQTGLIEAVEAAPNPMVAQNFQEVTQYCVMTNHIYTPNSIYISQSKLDSLDPAAQDIIKAAGRQAAEEAWDIIVESDEEAFQVMREAGMEFIEPDLQSFKDVMANIWGELGVDDIEGGWDIVNAVLALDPAAQQ